jgi:hypothetical protein
MTKLLNNPSSDLAAKARVVARWFEDFNRVSEEAEAAADAPPERTYTASEMSAARQEAWNDGFLAASRGQVSATARGSELLFQELLSQAEALDRKLDTTTEQHATSITRWLARNIMTALPDLSAAAMADRTRLVAGMLRTALRSQSRIEVRAGGKAVMICETMQDLCYQITRHEMIDHSTGDIVIAWDQGEARIDIEQTWDRIKAAILPLTGDIQQTVATTQTERHSHVG